VWSSYIDGYSYDGDISKWLSDVLDKENLDLVCFEDDLEPRENDPALYADSSPYMLISVSSLNDLNERLESKVTIRNFRPNFSVDQCNKAFAEVVVQLRFLFYFKIARNSKVGDVNIIIIII
jgi:uncharacterized protein YcbX